MSLTKQVKQTDYTLYYGQENSYLVIAGHGLASGRNNLFNYAATHYIHKNNLPCDYLAMNFHDAHTFLFTNIEKQTQMLNSVIEKYQHQYKKIFLVGVSYSALACLNANHNHVSKMVLVEPSLNISLMWQFETSKVIEIAGVEYYLNFDRHVPIAFSKILKQEGLMYNLNASKSLIEALRVKTLMIHAEKDEHYKLIEGVDLDTEYVSNNVIQNASHDFMEVGVLDQVIKKTFRFFDLN